MAIDEHSGGDEMKDADEKGEEAMETDKGKELLDARQGGEEEVTSNPNYHPYPKPLASYEDVMGNRNLFMETLEKLHLAMGTKFMIPTIGRKELDLYQLFVEVTSRGGFEKVVGEKRWKEVTNIFSFPCTATNASFVLRKYYMSLLCHYEQIYFFEAKGWSSLPKTPNTISCTPFQSKRADEYALPYPETQAATQKRRKYNGEVAQTGLIPTANQAVDGVIDGKFEDGYFITVTVGSAKLKGVLFHTSEQNAVQAVNHGNSRSSFTRHGRRKKLSTWNLTRPKPNQTGYNLFFAEQHARLKLLHSGKVMEISRTIGDLWNTLPEAQKAIYEERGLKDKERDQRAGDVISNVMPIQKELYSIQSVDNTMIDADEGDSDSEYGTDTDGEKLEDESELQTSTEAEPAIESVRMALNTSGRGGGSL